MARACAGIRTGHYDTLPSPEDLRGPAVTPKKSNQARKELEWQQVEDLLAMRLKAYYPYRRHLYVGETSLGEGAKVTWKRRGIEFVDPVEFEALFKKVGG